MANAPMITRQDIAGVESGDVVPQPPPKVSVVPETSRARESPGACHDLGLHHSTAKAFNSASSASSFAPRRPFNF